MTPLILYFNFKIEVKIRSAQRVVTYPPIVMSLVLKTFARALARFPNPSYVKVGGPDFIVNNIWSDRDQVTDSVLIDVGMCYSESPFTFSLKEWTRRHDDHHVDYYLHCFINGQDTRFKDQIFEIQRHYPYPQTTGIIDPIRGQIPPRIEQQIIDLRLVLSHGVDLSPDLKECLHKSN